MVLKFGKFIAVALVILVTAGGVQAQENVRVMVYNLLRYGAQGIGTCTPTGVTARNGWFNDILTETQPDIFGVNEIGPIDGPFSPWSNVSQNVLANVPGKGPFYEPTKILFNGSQDICNMMWYNSQKMGLSTQYLIPSAGSSSTRGLDYYKFYYKAPEPIVDSTFLHIVLVHLMASSSSGRAAQTAAIMDYFDTIGLSADDDYMVMGDMNMSTPNSAPFQTLINNGPLSLNDPLGITSNWTSSAFDYTWSQSTRNSGSSDCGAGGGLDDRFDLVVVSDGLMNPGNDDISYIPNSYWVVGNPFAPNAQVPSISADLVGMSDHYPVVVELEISKTVGLAGELADGIQLFASNPVNGDLNGRLVVPGGLEGQFGFSLVSMDGKVVWEMNSDVAAGEQDIHFDLGGIAAGIYSLKVAGPNSRPVIRKLVLLD